VTNPPVHAAKRFSAWSLQPFGWVFASSFLAAAPRLPVRPLPPSPLLPGSALALLLATRSEIALPAPLLFDGAAFALLPNDPPLLEPALPEAALVFRSGSVLTGVLLSFSARRKPSRWQFSSCSVSSRSLKFAICVEAKCCAAWACA
jgi:hypothetical protein